VGAAAGAIALVFGARAAAHGEEVERETERAASGYGGHAGEEGGKKGEHEEERGMLGLDLVLGWGRVPFARQNPPSGGPVGVTYTREDAVNSNVQSLLLSASLDIVEHVGVGLRLPLTFAGFTPSGSAGRSTTSFGNLELEGEYSAQLGPRLHIIGSLGLALPSAQGTEIPPDLNQAPAQQVDPTSYDRFSLNRAAASARAFEDNALFEPNRLGIVPKLAVTYGVRGLTLEPYLKVENLIGTSTTLEASYVGELVGGVRVGYWLHPRFELALKGFISAGFAGAAEDRKTTFALEPSALVRLGPVRPYVGLLIPLVGPPADNGFIGVRIGIAGSI
jgi:hypothetical protein